MIHLENIHKTYNLGTPNALHVLKGIDLHINKGELVSIMGSSGSGKSTLLNILGILDNYDEGTYHLNGHLIKDLNETQGARLRNELIGFVFQSFNLLNFKNAVENVALPLYYKGVPRKERYMRAMEQLDTITAAWAAIFPFPAREHFATNTLARSKGMVPSMERMTDRFTFFSSYIASNRYMSTEKDSSHAINNPFMA